MIQLVRPSYWTGCSTGIYDNPNSLARILVVGMGISLYWLLDWRTVFLRLLGLVSAFPSSAS